MKRYCHRCNDVTDSTKVSPAGRCILCFAPRLRVTPIETQPGAVAYYEAVRPLFEQTYDLLGLPPRVAQRFDGLLFYRICTKGGNSETVEGVLEAMEASGYGEVVESLDELLELEDEPVVEQVETLSAGAVDWGPPDIGYKPVSIPHAKGLAYNGKSASTPVLMPTHSPHVMECWRCQARSHILCVVPTQFQQTEELCNKCLSHVNAAREARGQRPLLYLSLPKVYG